MDMEMTGIRTEGGDGETRLSAGNTPEVNGEDVIVNLLDPLERGEADVGETTPLNGGPPTQTSTPQEESLVCRVQRELKELVFWKVRLWMIVVFIIVLIIAVIFIALAVCAAIHEDEDEKFDPSLFKVPLHRNGSFQLPNQVFTEDLSDMYSNKSRVLASNLQEKIAGLYLSSPALGRYFSEALINAFSRNGSVVADYQLRFLMPEEEAEQLRRFTLSREVVFNVFRQFLHDQDEERARPLYIAPDSLQMS